jgi:hypothetical protein
MRRLGLVPDQLLPCIRAQYDQWTARSNEDHLFPANQTPNYHSNDADTDGFED